MKPLILRIDTTKLLTDYSGRRGPVAKRLAEQVMDAVRASVDFAERHSSGNAKLYAVENRAKRAWLDWHDRTEGGL